MSTRSTCRRQRSSATGAADDGATRATDASLVIVLRSRVPAGRLPAYLSPAAR